MSELLDELLSDPTLRPLLLLDLLAMFAMIALLASRCMRRGYCIEEANTGRKMEMLNIAVRRATGMGLHSVGDYDWDDEYMTSCMFERANGDIVPGAVQTDGKGKVRVYERTGDGSGYRFLGEAGYEEIWKKPSRRRF